MELIESVGVTDCRLSRVAFAPTSPMALFFCRLVY